jgi:hypothetical protein
MQFLDVAELLDEPGEHIHFHQGRRLAGLAFGTQGDGTHAATQIALAYGFDLDETRRFDLRFGVLWHPGSGSDVRKLKEGHAKMPLTNGAMAVATGSGQAHPVCDVPSRQMRTLGWPATFILSFSVIAACPIGSRRGFCYEDLEAAWANIQARNKMIQLSQ